MKSQQSLFEIFDDTCAVTPPISISKRKKSKRKKNKVDVKKILLPHSQAKLAMYASYLEKYVAILSVVSKITKINIFDIFCGSGIYEDGNFGSPILAFNKIFKIDQKLSQSHKTYAKNILMHINDIDESNINRIKEYLSNQNSAVNLEVTYSSKDAEVMLENIYEFIQKQDYSERNLIFVDPYGYKKIDRHIIEKLLKTKRVEIILFLPVSHMHRFKDVVQIDEINKSYVALRNFILSFFSEEHPVRYKSAISDKIDIFELIKYIEEALSFDKQFYSTSFYLQRNSSNYYALFFATSSILGLERIVDVKWEIDSLYGEGFRIGNGQMSMFLDQEKNKSIEARYNALKNCILDVILKNNIISNIDLYYTAILSNFKPSHMKDVIKILHEQGVLTVKMADDSKQRKGAYYITSENCSGPSCKPKLYISKA